MGEVLDGIAERFAMCMAEAGMPVHSLHWHGLQLEWQPDYGWAEPVGRAAYRAAVLAAGAAEHELAACEDCFVRWWTTEGPRGGPPVRSCAHASPVQEGAEDGEA